MAGSHRISVRLACGVVALVAVSILAPVTVGATSSPHWKSPATTLGVPAITSVSCSSAHNCAAFGGTTTEAESSGTWAAATSIANLPIGATIGAIACPRPTDCVVGGSSGGQAFLLDESHGVWGVPQLISGTAPYVMGTPTIYDQYSSSITSISCVSTTECTAAGNYTIHLEPTSIVYGGPGFATTLSSGVWSAATMVNGVDAVTDLVCLTAHSCTLSGYESSFQIFVVYPIVTNVAVVDTETSSGWGSASAIAGLTALGGKSGWIDSESSTLSCQSVGNCTLGGTDEFAPHFDGNPISVANASFHGFAAREVNGTWRAATELTDLTGVSYLACSSSTHCAGADSSHVVLESGGRWGRARDITVSRQTLAIGAVACVTNGPCLVAAANGRTARALTATAGSWSAPQPLAGLKLVSSASCPSKQNCVVAGGSMVISQS